MYPGSKLPPGKIISQLASQNPQVTLSSEVLVDKGYDECENIGGEATQELSCPITPGVEWKKLQIDNDGSKKMLCININPANVSEQMTTGGSSIQEERCNLYVTNAPPALCCKNHCGHMLGNTCTGYGATRLRFSLDDSALQEKLFEQYCEGWLTTKFHNLPQI